MDSQHQEHVMKYVVDGAAITGWLGAMLGYLPLLAAALSILWTAIRIYETKTFQSFLKRLRSW